MKKLLAVLLVAMMSLTLFGCQKAANDDDIVVLFTNDVHCGIDENIGYAGLKAYKNSLTKNHKYVVTVDCGDAVQGDVVGTVSKGDYLVDIMNNVGYDFCTFGNHEFDYGMDVLKGLLEKSNAQYLACNISYSGTQGNALEKAKAYSVVTYGKTKVGFVGVATPESIVKSTPTYFQEDGKYVYDFTGSSINALAAKVQESVDAARKEGAQYIVLLSHLGDDVSSEPFTSTSLAGLVSGVDAILDGHSHSTVPCRMLADKDGANVLVASTGTKLERIGQLTIGANGVITSTVISDYAAKDEETVTFIDGIKAKYEELVNQKVFSSEVNLSDKDENGVRLVRSRETGLGNLCADAYKFCSGADIAWVNGGGIRAAIKEGDITYADVIKLHPYGNMLTVVKATGAEIVDALEMASRSTQKEYAKDGNAVGENGGFLQVSGIEYTIDTKVKSTVEINDKNEFVSVKGARRVCNVRVYNSETGKFEDIDLNKTYTLACHDYMLKSGGDGINMFMDNELVMDASKIDNQVLIDYIQQGLNGVIPASYATLQGRITIK